MNNMILQTLLDKYTNAEILTRLQELYDDTTAQIENYNKVITNLKNYTEYKTGGLPINIQAYEDDDVTVFDVSGVGKNGENFAIEFCPWQEWLGAEITQQTIDNISELDIVCHCLWEMTWCGFEENEIQNRAEHLGEIAKDAILHPENNIPFESIFKDNELI